MARAPWYPPADRSQDRSQYSYSWMDTITKCLLHSTETQGWPGYPTFAPQLTYDPWRHQWRQHMPLPRSASTLADPSWTAVRENRDDVVQVEIVGYCDPQRWDDYGHNVEKMDDRALQDLGEFIAWLHHEWDVPLTALPADEWVRYPKSYGYSAAQRLTSSQFDTFKGVLGHQHASGNSHGDPGHIDIARIMIYALGEDDMPLTEGDLDKIEARLMSPANLNRIADALLNRDGVPNWINPDENKNLIFKNAVNVIGNQTRDPISRILKALEDLAAAQSAVTVEHVSPPS